MRMKQELERRSDEHGWPRWGWLHRMGPWRPRAGGAAITVADRVEMDERCRPTGVGHQDGTDFDDWLEASKPLSAP